MTETVSSPPPAKLSQGEFIALMAMLFATIAFSTDAMLPALPDMATQLSPNAPNKVQLVITSFVLGMGIGTLFTGPLSDAFGRKPVVLAGAFLFCVAALAGAMAGSLEALLVARVLQGIGASGPRVVSLALIRDLYEGRGMARIMSFVMMVFTLVPAIAPTLGAAIIAVSGWRGVFVAFVLFSLLTATWLAVRQSETLPPERRRPFTLALVASGVREVLSHPVSFGAILVQTLLFGILFLSLSTVQPIFDVTFDQGETFHLWFGLIALLSASASLLNARLVERLGMRFIVQTVLTAQVVVTGLYCLTLWLPLPDAWALGLFVAWIVALFAQAGLTIGNLNALAMDPMGHLAGLAASVVGSVATIGAVVLSVPVGLAFDGTPRPTAVATWIFVVLALLLMRRLNRI